VVHSLLTTTRIDLVWLAAQVPIRGENQQQIVSVAMLLTDHRDDSWALLAWTALTLPAWILLLKVYKLYESYTKRISHTVVDDVPWLSHSLLLGSLGFWMLTHVLPVEKMTLLEGAIFGVTALVTILLTQPMSNAAAALVVVPVALSAARELGVQERTFAIAIMLAASISFIAPFEPASILVYGPGRYRFADFLKVGGGLTLLLAIIVLLLIPVFWPLQQK
jgi:hypothetical protein